MTNVALQRSDVKRAEFIAEMMQFNIILTCLCSLMIWAQTGGIASGNLAMA